MKVECFNEFFQLVLNEAGTRWDCMTSFHKTKTASINIYSLEVQQSNKHITPIYFIIKMFTGKPGRVTWWRYRQGVADADERDGAASVLGTEKDGEIRRKAAGWHRDPVLVTYTWYLVNHPRKQRRQQSSRWKITAVTLTELTSPSAALLPRQPPPEYNLLWLFCLSEFRFIIVKEGEELQVIGATGYARRLRI